MFAAGWWMLLVGFLGQVPLGLSVAVGYRSPIWGWHRRRMAEALWGTQEIPPEAWPVAEQLLAMLGATMACWGLAMAAVVAVPLRRRELWAWWCVAASALLWFTVDTGLSAANGVRVNVAFNCAAALMMGLPLALVWPGLRR